MPVAGVRRVIASTNIIVIAVVPVNYEPAGEEQWGARARDGDGRTDGETASARIRRVPVKYRYLRTNSIVKVNVIKTIYTHTHTHE